MTIIYCQRETETQQPQKNLLYTTILNSAKNKTLSLFTEELNKRDK